MDIDYYYFLKNINIINFKIVSQLCNYFEHNYLENERKNLRIRIEV